MMIHLLFVRMHKYQRENLQNSTNIATIIISAAAYNKQIRFNVHLDSASESSKNHLNSWRIFDDV